MPRVYRDVHSGALLFTPTPDEQLLIDLQQTVDKQNDTLEQLQAFIPLLGNKTVQDAIKSVTEGKGNDVGLTGGD